MYPETPEVDGWRTPTFAEQALLDRLLTVDFPGRDALVAQFAALVVRRIAFGDSLALRTNETAPLAAVSRRIPVEAEATDADGVTVHILLHVLQGVMDELEVYREDSGHLLHPLDPCALSGLA